MSSTVRQSWTWRRRRFEIRRQPTTTLDSDQRDKYLWIALDVQIKIIFVKNTIGIVKYHWNCFLPCHSIILSNVRNKQRFFPSNQPASKPSEFFSSNQSVSKAGESLSVGKNSPNGKGTLFSPQIQNQNYKS